MKTLIVADDLTGALDSAVTFAGCGLRCTVARRPADIPAAMADRAGRARVSTASREGSPEAATGAVSGVFDAVGDRPSWSSRRSIPGSRVMCAAEVGMVAARTGIERAVVSPAIPAQGRATEGGRLSGAGVASPIDVAAIFAGAGVRVEVPDAATDADLDRVVTAAMSGDPVLLVGAAGLAAAVARHLRPGARPAPVGNLPAPLLLAIGSHDPDHAGTARRLARRRRAGTARPRRIGWKCRRAASARTRCCFGSSPAAMPFDPLRANAHFAEVRCRKLSSPRASGRCSPAAARPRTPSWVRSASAFSRSRARPCRAFRFPSMVVGGRRTQTCHQVRRVRRTLTRSQGSSP